ncbi:MAG TPA: hypothetical protein VFA37_02100 [Gaiellaceae bacterium]|nr:hypothetical protein [Gaiellaceae bacterium]
MATDVAETTPLPEAAPPPEPRGTLYFGRFYAVYVVLGIALCAAIVGVVIAARSTGGSGAGQGWSSWHPTGGGIGLAQQIATRVGGEYRLGNGDQLAAVIAKPPIVSLNNHKIDVGYVAIRGGKSGSDVVASTSSSNTVMYSVCGLGTSCSIPFGTPSPARGRLVRREIVELALYTFHYDGAVQNIIAFMPPTGAGKQPVMIFLQRSDLGSSLSQPLDRTLNAHTPTASTMTRADASKVDELTNGHSYNWTFQQAQDGNAIFVLTRLRA